MTRSLTYIGQTPAEGTGSPVIVLRHLRRLAEHGWKITVIGEHGQDVSACERAGWTVKHLPLRRSWWPPFRPQSKVLRSLRTALLARECRFLTAGNPPDAIFGYLAAHADFSPEIAAHLARQTGTPYTLLVHDDAGSFGSSDDEKYRLRKRHAWIIRQTHRCWFVSPELAAEYEVPMEARRVLLPIPEGWSRPAKYEPKRSQSPKVYYAGFIWPPQYPLLAKIAKVLAAAGARLVLLTRETPELKAFLAQEQADWVQPFPTNNEALAHLVTQATGLLVSYSDTLAEMPWVATSFPSKFVEYSHLGLPCSIVAPAESAIGRWSHRESYPHFYTPARLDAFQKWASSLKAEDHWRGLASTAAALARGPFSPEVIHAQLEDGLLRPPQ